MNARTYRVYARRAVFFGQRADLQCDLHQSARDAPSEDYGAEGVVEDGFEVAFFGACGGVASVHAFVGMCGGESFLERRKWDRVLPTPAAGRTFTSTVASSGSSSLRCTSMGPLTAPTMQKPLCEKVAEPSARCRCESWASGAMARMVYFCAQRCGGRDIERVLGGRSW